jgi:MFS family permease
MVPSTIGMIFMGLLVGRITRRFGAKPMLVGGAALAGSPFAVLAFAHSSPALFLIAITTQGFGVGLAFSSMSNLIMSAVPSSQTGVATGMNANIRTIGGSIGSQVVTTVVTAGSSASGVPRESGYTLGFALLSLAMIAAAVAALAVPRRRVGAGPGQGPAGAATRRSNTAPLAVRA